MRNPKSLEPKSLVPLPLEMATFDVLSQEERTEFYRDAIRRAHAARADAVRALFRVFKRRFHRQPLMTRAAMSSAAVFAVALSLGVTILSLRFA
jgi:hypothetical protein